MDGGGITIWMGKACHKPFEMYVGKGEKQEQEYSTSFWKGIICL
jgi:hypothetical protein